MKYRSKLYLALTGTAIASSLLATGIVFQETKKLFLKEYQSKVLSISATTAALIEGDLLNEITSPGDVQKEPYIKLQRQLREARNANQRSDILVRYIYTLRPSKSSPGQLEFVVDSADLEQNLSNIGDIYGEADEKMIIENINQNFVPEEFIRDQWGNWLSGFTPIYDSDGNYVATLGVDIGARDINMEISRLLFFGATGIFAAVILATFFAFFLSRIVTRSLRKLCETVHDIEKGDLNIEAQTSSHDEFEEVGRALNSMIQGLKERELIGESFGRYVSPHILKKVLESKKIPQAEGGQRKRLTVLFADTRSFTSLSEKMKPADVINLLNEFFGELVQCIFNHHGTVDKFLGDGMMAEFNAILDNNNHEESAIRAALEMQIRLDALNKKWQAEGRPTLSMGIGIHTGNAITGNIGSEKRIEFTCIGDAVNVASRLEELTKHHNAKIIVSDETLQNAGDYFISKEIGDKIEIRGRQETMKLHSIEGEKK